eukprot:GFUD01137429.1.p1 GENE.GFUD01137429.1~~GFUD01137429.1.p1  ORF type:complete len:690 (-),score=126.84 GFUD01137429.1:168-2216(-)
MLLPLLLACFHGLSLAAPRTTNTLVSPLGPDYLRVKEVSTNNLIAVLMKGDNSQNGAALWQTPDNKSAIIQLTSVKVMRMTINSWEMILNIKQVKFSFLGGPINQTMVFPHDITWYFEDTEQKILRVEQSDEKEYNALYFNHPPTQAELEASGPEYLRLKNVANNTLIAVLMKGDTTQNGAALWQTPDNKSARINVTEVPVKSWEMLLNINEHEVRLLGPVSQTMVSPLEVIWYYKKTEKKWPKEENLLVEQSDEKEYKMFYSKNNHPKPTKALEHLPKQVELEASVPDYLSLKFVENNHVIALLKKNDEIQNGASSWQTPDNKSFRIYLSNEPVNNTWVLLCNSTYGLLGPRDQTIASPHEVKWFSYDEKEDKYIEDGRLLVEESNQEEYNSGYRDKGLSSIGTAETSGPGGLTGLAGLVGLPSLTGIALKTPQLAAIMAVGGILSRTGVIGGVGSGTSGLVEGAGVIASGALDGISQTAGGIFTGAGQGLNSGLSVVGLDKVGLGLEHALAGMGEGIGGIGDGLGQGVNKITSGASDGMKKITGGVDNIFGGGGFDGLSSGIGGIISGGGAITGGVIDGLASGTSGVIEGAGNIASGALDGIGKTAGGIFTDAGEGLNKGFSTIGLGFVGGGVDTLLGGAGQGISMVGQGVSRGVQTVTNTVGSVASTFGNIGKSILGGK